MLYPANYVYASYEYLPVISVSREDKEIDTNTYTYYDIMFLQSCGILG